MNKAAMFFKALVSVWSQDASSPEVETLAANLASEIACANGPIRLCIWKAEQIYQLFGLIYFLDTYGLLLRQQFNEYKGVRYAYIILDRKSQVASEYEGNICTERKMESRETLERLLYPPKILDASTGKVRQLEGAI